MAGRIPLEPKQKERGNDDETNLVCGYAVACDFGCFDGARRRADGSEGNVFSLSDVRLEGGRLGLQQDQNRKYLLWIDPDRLLSQFRSSAGLKPKAPHYAGWENGFLPGHILAFWMAGAAMTVEATGDLELRRRILYAVDELAEVQKAYSCGYALAPEGGRQLWRDVAAGKFDVPHENKKEANGWHINGAFEPIYTLNKMLLGLHYTHRATGSEKAKKVFLDLSDWFGHDVVDRLSDEQVQKLIFCEHGSLPETFVYAERMTGDKKYGAWARRLCATTYIEGMTGDNADWLTGHHANNDIPRFTGFEHVCRLTGEEKLHRAAVNAWTDIVSHRIWANGGNSEHEHFFDPAEFEQNLNGSGCESCNSVNMLRLTEVLFESDPTSAYVDFYERCLYNHILSTHEPGLGRTVYFTSLKPGDYRMYAHAFESMWCCVGTGLEAPGKYAQMVFTHAADDSAVSVQLFEPASLEWRARGVRLRQSTQFPAGECSRVMVEAVGANPDFALKVRVPAWSPKLTMSVNGVPVEAAADASGYLTVKRTWKPGDVVDISFPMTVRAERLPASEKYLALFYGPTLLAGELGREGLEFDDFISSKDKKNYHVWYHKKIPEIRIPTMSARTLADPASALVRDRTLPLAFRLKDDPTVRLVPMMDLHFQRYAIYWPIE